MSLDNADKVIEGGPFKPSFDLSGAVLLPGATRLAVFETCEAAFPLPQSDAHLFHYKFSVPPSQTSNPPRATITIGSENPDVCPSPETGIRARKKAIQKRSLTTRRCHGKRVKWPEIRKVRR